MPPRQKARTTASCVRVRSQSYGGGSAAAGVRIPSATTAALRRCSYPTNLRGSSGGCVMRAGAPFGASWPTIRCVRLGRGRWVTWWWRWVEENTCAEANTRVRAPLLRPSHYSKCWTGGPVDPRVARALLGRVRLMTRPLLPLLVKPLILHRLARPVVRGEARGTDLKEYSLSKEYRP